MRLRKAAVHRVYDDFIRPAGKHLIQLYVRAASASSIISDVVVSVASTKAGLRRTSIRGNRRSIYDVRRTDERSRVARWPFTDASQTQFH
jgi:hypothetical protein